MQFLKSAHYNAYLGILANNWGSSPSLVKWILWAAGTYPRWIMGPSGPTGIPQPIAATHDRNLATIVRRLKIWRKCVPFRNPVTSGMPEPPALGRQNCWQQHQLTDTALAFTHQWCARYKNTTSHLHYKWKSKHITNQTACLVFCDTTLHKKKTWGGGERAWVCTGTWTLIFPLSLFSSTVVFFFTMHTQWKKEHLSACTCTATLKLASICVTAHTNKQETHSQWWLQHWRGWRPHCSPQ